MNKIITIAVVLFSFLGCQRGFDLEVRLTGTKTDFEFVKDGSVQLRFGKHEPLPPQPLDARGRAFFTNIDLSYKNDTVSVIYLPNKPVRFRVVDQNLYTVGNRPYVQFYIDFPPEFTEMMWSLRDKDGNGIEGATITFDKHMVAKTTSNGYFDVSVQKPAGEKVHFLIEKDGKVLMDKDIAVYPEYRRLIIE
jgi:hypothetical protein